MAGRANERNHSPFELGSLIHDVSRLRRTIVDKTLRPLGVTGSQWWVLVNLSKSNSDGLPQTRLAESMAMGKTTLGELVYRLEKSGHVRRKPEPGDRRTNRVVLTLEGRKLLTRIQATARALDMRIMGGVSADKMLRAESVLRKIKTRLIDMDSIAGSSRSA